MPLAYPDGTLAEHRACRTGAVAFDVSHLGTVRVEGPGAFELPAARPHQRPAPRSRPGRAQYTHLLDRRRLGDRRHHRLVGRRRIASTSCPTPRTPPGCSTAIGGARHHRRAGRHRRPGPRGPAPARRRWPPRPPPWRASRWPRSPGRARAAWPPGPATPARTGSSAPCRPRWPRRFWRAPCSTPGWSRPGSGPATPCASRPGCPCTATSSARASRRSRPAWAGWWAGTRATSGAGPPWSASGPTGPAPPAARAWWPTGASRPVTDAAVAGRRRSVVGTVTSGNFSPDARAGHRPGPGRHGRRRGCRATR